MGRSPFPSQPTDLSVRPSAGARRPRKEFGRSLNTCNMQRSPPQQRQRRPIAYVRAYHTATCCSASAVRVQRCTRTTDPNSTTGMMNLGIDGFFSHARRSLDRSAAAPAPPDADRPAATPTPPQALVPPSLSRRLS